MSTTIRLKANKNGTFYYSDFASSHSDSSVFMSEDLPNWLHVDPLDNTLKGIPKDLGEHQFTIHKKTIDNFKLESTIPGEVSGDDFGTAVSMNKDGSIMAVGGSGRDIGPWEGYVRVFQYIEIEQSVWDSSNTSSSRSIDGVPILLCDGDYSPILGKRYWMQMGKDIDASSPGDNFGYIFKLSDDGYTVVLSSYSNGGNNQGTGSVVVYQYNGQQWVQMGSSIEAMAADYEAGVSLATNAHGNIVCIGSYDSNEEDSFSGHVRIFKYSHGDWSQMGNNLACEEKGHESGYSITMNNEGTRVAIATYKNNNEDGSIYVYNWDGKQWSLLGGNLYLDKSWNYTIYSIAMNHDGSILAIGAYGEDGIWNGYVRIYQYRTVTAEEWDAKWIHKVPDIITNGDLHYDKEAQYWIQIGNDIVCESVDDDFEYSVTMNDDGSRLATAIYTSRNSVSDGKIKIYKFVRNQWIQMGKTIKIDAVYDNFDKTVFMNSDGTKIMFGTFDDDNTGSISVFSLIDDSDPHEYNIILEVEEEEDLEEISRLELDELKELEITEEEHENSSDAESMEEQVLEFESDSDESKSDIDAIEVIDTVIFHENDLSIDNESELEEVNIDKPLLEHDDSLINIEKVTSNSIIDELETFVEIKDQEEADAEYDEAERKESEAQIERKEEAAKELAAKQQAAKELAAKELAAKELAAKQQASKELAAKELAAKQQAAKELAAKQQAAKVLAAKELAAKQQAAKQEVEKKKAIEALRKAELQQRLQVQKRPLRRGQGFGMTMKYTKDNKELHEKELHTRNMLHK